jgi:hypothetical protein
VLGRFAILVVAKELRPEIFGVHLVGRLIVAGHHQHHRLLAATFPDVLGSFLHGASAAMAVVQDIKTAL